MQSKTTTSCFMSQDWKETFHSHLIHQKMLEPRGEVSRERESPSVFSEPENSMFLQLTGSCRFRSGSGLFRFEVWPVLAMEGGGERDEEDVTLQVSCAMGSKDRTKPGGTTAVQMRTRWPREMAAVATAGSQGRSLRHGPRLMYLLENPSAEGDFSAKSS